MNVMSIRGLDMQDQSDMVQVKVGCEIEEIGLDQDEVGKVREWIQPLLEGEKRLGRVWSKRWKQLVNQTKTVQAQKLAWHRMALWMREKFQRDPMGARVFKGGAKRLIQDA